MPMGQYSNFADCVAKNKSKDDPNAYCGYIKHQIEDKGKKKEECLMEEGHEAYHLEEEIKKGEEEMGATEAIGLTKDSIEPGSREVGGTGNPLAAPVFPGKEVDVIGWEEEVRKVEEELTKLEEEEIGRSARVPKGVRHIRERMGDDEWTPIPDASDKAEAKAFLNTLDATIHDLETLVATAEGKQPSGYGSPTTAVSPTDVFFKVNVKDQALADIVVKQAGNGLEVQTDWFDSVLDELADIRASAQKFMIESGFNSKDTVKEYNKAWKENNKTRKD
jgi:hypothetical protein